MNKLIDKVSKHKQEGKKITVKLIKVNVECSQISLRSSQSLDQSDFEIVDYI